jgi:hypothetical protein
MHMGANKAYSAGLGGQGDPQNRTAFPVATRHCLCHPPTHVQPPTLGTSAQPARMALAAHAPYVIRLWQGMGADVKPAEL